MFPDGLVIDIKNRQYLTSKVNGLFVAIAAFTRDSEVENKKLFDKNAKESYSVPGTGLEPAHPYEH